MVSATGECLSEWAISYYSLFNKESTRLVSSEVYCNGMQPVGQDIKSRMAATGSPIREWEMEAQQKNFIF
jgi:hypothetical protein